MSMPDVGFADEVVHSFPSFVHSFVVLTQVRFWLAKMALISTRRPKPEHIFGTVLPIAENASSPGFQVYAVKHLDMA